jgi:Repeat of unknown function (DUF5907)
MATGVVSWSKTAATNASSDSAQNWAEGMAPSAVNDSARGGMASVAKWRDDLNGTIVTGGTGTAYTATTNQGFTALTAGLEITFQLNADCGSTVQINVDGLGLKPLRSAPNVELVAGAILNGSIHRATYATSNSGEWLLQEYRALTAGEVTSAALATNAVTTAAITAANVTYAKIQNVAASSLLGNPTGSGAAPSEITLGSGLAFSSTTLKATLNPTLVPNYLSGLALSTAGSSATMSIAAGVANDSTNTTLMSLAATSKTTASWVVGAGNGGIDTGAIANSTWYHFYEIERTDTGVTDVIFSLSASSPALPTSYTLYRRIGSGKTNGSGQWTLFTQVGDQFLWGVTVLDANATAASAATRTTIAVSVPTGIVVNALMRVFLNASGGNLQITITSLLESDVVPSLTLADAAAATGTYGTGVLSKVTNTSAQVGWRTNSTGGTFSINTYGWLDTRGK